MRGFFSLSRRDEEHHETRCFGRVCACLFFFDSTNLKTAAEQLSILTMSGTPSNGNISGAAPLRRDVTQILDECISRWASDETAIAVARAIAFTIFAHPYDVIRMRMHAPTTNQQFVNSWDCAKHMWHQNGARLFFKGSSIPLFGHMVTSRTYFFLYGEVNRALVEQQRAFEYV
jgi:hypothetical protein